MLALWHLVQRIGPAQVNELVAQNHLLAEFRDFYRIFFYHCPPFETRMHWAVSRRSVDFSKAPKAIFRRELHREVLKIRKVALRHGRLNDTAKCRLSESSTAKFIANPGRFQTNDSDFDIDANQKGVDTRLGLDIASLAFKKQVDQIVIVAADADFVPAAKLARRQGIDVVLDRMGETHAATDLLEHVDALRDCFLAKSLGLTEL